MNCRLIISGGRDYRLNSTERQWISSLPITITEVITGGCRGTDQDAEQWAHNRNIPVTTFPADWHKHGKSAGSRRNAAMAAYGNALAVFPGNRGTESMRQCAMRAGLRIFTFPD